VPRLTELLGCEVVDAAGVRAGRLVDLAVDLGEVEPTVLRVLFRKERRGQLLEVPWVAVADLGPPVRLRSAADPGAASPKARNELLLAAHVLDRQIFDGRGMCLRRVGDVDLALADSRLHLRAVEVGVATLCRRVGLARLTRGISAEVVDWPELHLTTGPGHALQLRSGAAGIHRLSVDQLAALALHLPTPRADEVLGAATPARAEAARALAPPFLHRRGRWPLHFRHRAPS
jgi:sporulation protein YlmC with PRC-barrel domain